MECLSLMESTNFRCGYEGNWSKNDTYLTSQTLTWSAQKCSCKDLAWPRCQIQRSWFDCSCCWSGRNHSGETCCCISPPHPQFQTYARVPCHQTSGYTFIWKRQIQIREGESYVQSLPYQFQSSTLFIRWQKMTLLVYKCTQRAHQVVKTNFCKDIIFELLKRSF